jgi:hypothetical protein
VQHTEGKAGQTCSAFCLSARTGGVGAAKSPDQKTSLLDVLRSPARNPFAPQAKRVTPQFGAHQFDDVSLRESKLLPDCIERSAILPSHFDHAVDLLGSEVFPMSLLQSSASAGERFIWVAGNPLAFSGELENRSGRLRLGCRLVKPAPERKANQSLV